jgi:hypothetical protein
MIDRVNVHMRDLERSPTYEHTPAPLGDYGAFVLDGTARPKPVVGSNVEAVRHAAGEA